MNKEAIYYSTQIPGYLHNSETRRSRQSLHTPTVAKARIKFWVIAEVWSLATFISTQALVDAGYNMWTFFGQLCPVLMLFIYQIAELWVRASMLRAATLVRRRFFPDCACKLLFNTNCSKVWLWVSQCEDLKFANVPWCLLLWLSPSPLKWENVPLTQRGVVWTNGDDNDGSI